MSHPEKFAQPGVYLDTDDHARLIDDNREQRRRDRIEELRNELQALEERGQS